MVSGMKQSFVAVQSTFTLIFSAAPNVVPRIRATLTLLIAWSGNVPFVCGHLLRHGAASVCMAILIYAIVRTIATSHVAPIYRY